MATDKLLPQQVLKCIFSIFTFYLKKEADSISEMLLLSNVKVGNVQNSSSNYVINVLSRGNFAWLST